MSRLTTLRALAPALVWALACASGAPDSSTATASEFKESPGQLARARTPERMIARTADLDVEVSDPERSVAEVHRLVTEAGGIIEQSTRRQDEGAWLRCRVPADRLASVMDAVAALGDETRRTVGAEDVTDAYADLDTRLRNDIALRDRLRELLSRAKDVEEILAVEKELTRIQTEIESQQAQLDRLRSRVELSTLSISLHRERILGPLGYLGYGVWWAISKLFVIH